jgi:hypothetical protein
LKPILIVEKNNPISYDPNSKYFLSGIFTEFNIKNENGSRIYGNPEMVYNSYLKKWIGKDLENILKLIDKKDKNE